MILWIDVRQGTYGVEQEPGYGESDRKALNFKLGQDLRIEVGDVPPLLPTQSGQAAARALQANPNLQRFRFQPDGFIDESSPQSIVLREASGETLWVTQSRNRLSYEIAGNGPQRPMRGR